MKINVKGLKFQNLMYLTAFSVIILVVLWALQFLFLGSFYQRMKLSETRNIGEKIINAFHNENFHVIIEDYAFNNNLRIILLDESGSIGWGYDGFRTNTSSGIFLPDDLESFLLNTFDRVKEKLEEANVNSIGYINETEQDDMSQAIYAAKVYDASGTLFYLYISNPIPPIDSTVSVLTTQFIIVTIILFALSLVVAQWISRKMSKPIINLTKSAEQLVKGELDATFYDDGFTEIQQLASAMNYATNELRSLDNYRKEFIANVTHDLKTPLTIIKFYGEMIKDVSGNNPQKRDEHCDIIIKETDWLTGMVEEILELSKLESNKDGVTETTIDLSQSLADILVRFQALSAKDGYSFETDIENNLLVLGNEPMLRRVLYNLISNAVNFTGEDKRVSISLKTAADHVRFEVTDTGKGIPENKQSVIWDRYYKSNEVHKRPVIGTGLGLSIVKNVLVRHKAEYGVISETGQGSTFWFELKRFFPDNHITIADSPYKPCTLELVNMDCPIPTDEP